MLRDLDHTDLAAGNGGEDGDLVSFAERGVIARVFLVDGDKEFMPRE